MTVSNYNLKGASCVFGAFLIQFSLGTVYTFGNMSPYIASYLKFRTEDRWVTTGDTVWILAGTFLLMGSLMAVGGLLQNKIGSRFTCTIGCLSMSLSVILTYFTVQKSLLLVILTYGIGFGIGNGISYSVSLTAAMRWFPNQKGLITGIVVGGFGLGSFLFNLIQTKIINPSNISPRFINSTHNVSDSTMAASNATSMFTKFVQITRLSQEKYFLDERTLNRVPICFVIIGVTYVIIQIIGIIMLMDHGAYKSLRGTKLKRISTDSQEKKSLNDSDITSTKTTSMDSTDECVEFSVMRAIKHKMFWLLWATFFLNGLGIVTISSVYKAFGQQFINDDQYFAILGSVGGLCNCGGRVVWGRLNDKFKYRIVMSALTMLMSLSMGTFYFCSFISNPVIVKVVYYIYGCLLFLALSGSFAIIPCAAAQCFGNRNLATIYGLIFTGLATASVSGAIVSSFCFRFIQYRGQFVIATIAGLISLSLAQLFRPPRAQTQKK